MDQLALRGYEIRHVWLVCPVVGLLGFDAFTDRQRVVAFGTILAFLSHPIMHQSPT